MILTSITGPNGIQLFSDGGNLFMIPSVAGTKYDCYVFDLLDQSTDATTLAFGAAASGWTVAIPLSAATTVVLASPFSVFCVAQETPVADKPCRIIITGKTKMDVTKASAVIRGTALKVDATNDDVRDGGAGRTVALSESTLAASGIHPVYFDGINYRG